VRLGVHGSHGPQVGKRNVDVRTCANEHVNVAGFPSYAARASGGSEPQALMAMRFRRPSFLRSGLGPLQGHVAAGTRGRREESPGAIVRTPKLAAYLAFYGRRLDSCGNLSDKLLHTIDSLQPTLVPSL
jgi:hypothetical protein